MALRECLVNRGVKIRVVTGVGQQLEASGLSSICKGQPWDDLVFAVLGRFSMNPELVGRVHDYQKTQCSWDDLAVENG